MDLNQRQARLASHFKTLAEARREHNLPVFALEHGLTPADIAALTLLLHKQLRGGGRLGDHWLLWVIYAAEQGYNYDGNEYWPTFESRTPYWTLQGDRQQLRAWFVKFHQQFNGLKPSGHWAEWFSIISWPITHAVLPKDLQSQLAKTLYLLRYQLAAQINKSPAEIGRYVAQEAFETSSRFRNFVEQKDIAGRIILALLNGDREDVKQAIHPLTLGRIVEDLHRTRNAQAWLRDTRNAIVSAQMKGASLSNTHQPITGGQKSDHSVPKQTDLNIRPRLVLRRTGKHEWTAGLEIPGLRQVGDLAPELNEFLRRTRCSISGSLGWLPAGWLLAGQQRRVLSEWPETGTSVIKFERSNATVEHLLQNDARISPGPIWVFNIGPDGLAHENVGRVVRPGGNYIVVSREPIASPSFRILDTLNCSGLFASTIELQTRVPAEQVGELQSQGLSVSLSVRIWPIGLPPRQWDGEGYSEWLEGEIACFALSNDHPVDSFEVQLDNEPKEKVPIPSGLNKTFIRLPPLTVGKHWLRVRAIHPASFTSLNRASEGFITILVRTPQPWISGSAGHTGFIATIVPQEPSLDEFWEGRTQLTILGPVHRPATISVELLGASGENLSSEIVATPSLPTTQVGWEQAVASFLKKERDTLTYLAASSGKLLIDCGDIGVLAIPLRREVAPLRWVSHKSRRKTVLRLVDDNEGVNQLTVDFYSFEQPTTSIGIKVDQVKADYEPLPPGGLFVVTYGTERQSLIVSVPRVEDGFGRLLVDALIDTFPWTFEAVKDLVHFANMWSGARYVGPLAAQRRSRIVTALEQHIFRILCGQAWSVAESTYLLSPRSEADLKRLGDKIGGNQGFGIVLARDTSQFLELDVAARLDRFAALAGRYEIAQDSVSRDALEFCEELNQGMRWDEKKIDRYVENLKRSAIAVRGGRFLALAKVDEQVRQSEIE